MDKEIQKKIQQNKKKFINRPEHKLPIKPLTKDEFATHIKKRVDRISREFTDGFDFMEGMERTVTIFGSARFKPGNPHYKKARELGERLAEYGIGVTTGGGAGIMEAGNRGAFEAGGTSLGLNIHLPHEQAANPYLSRTMQFKYFFSRKVLLSYAAEVYVFFPGGFGTLDEFFEMLTLVQTHKLEPLPIICMGSDYWNKLEGFIKDVMYEEHKAIDKNDTKLYTITDDIDEAMKIILKAPIRKAN